MRERESVYDVRACVRAWVCGSVRLVTRNKKR